MGLGKTLSALAFMSGSERKSGSPHLVVAPTGLLENWRAEERRHLNRPGLGRLVQAYSPHLASLRRLRGDGTRELFSGLPTLDVASLAQADWVLTTYETLRDYQHSFARVPWTVVVFDEAQRIKNPYAGVTNAARAMNARFRIALTGTPIENRLSDLWSIVDGVVHAGYLGTLKEFEDKYSGASSLEKANASELEAALKRSDRGGPLMKRRMKKDHLEGLPTKTERLLRVEMPRRQADLYESVVAEAKKGTPGNAFLRILQRLREVSLHPAMEDGALDDEGFISQSARVREAFRVLDEIARKGQRALLFTEYRRMQGALVELLQRRYRLKRPPMIINGDVAGTERQKRVDEFQAESGFGVMVLSPKAGGVGLTLTSANHVIHLSRWWNPAVEDQSTDRVYRIGQARPVEVHLPIAVHPKFGDSSFDVQLHRLLERKRALSQSALGCPEISRDDERELYSRVVDGA
jgi:SNF2 family DNA or RNA helicase